MYIPTHFREDRPAVLHEIMQRNSFATLVSQSDGSMVASQLPFLIDTERNALRSHMARGNPQWKELAARELMVIFQGPHAYISPSWYEAMPAVPTWNYATVHAYGTARLLEDGPALRAIVEETVRQHEEGRENPWRMEQLAEEYVQKLLRGIVGFEISITRLEGKLKLNQNRSEADARGVIEGLRAEGNTESAAVAEWMERVGKST